MVLLMFNTNWDREVLTYKTIHYYRPAITLTVNYRKVYTNNPSLMMNQYQLQFSTYERSALCFDNFIISRK